MKRKYPVSFFLSGVLGNLISYFFIGLIGLIIFIIGLFGVPVCKIIGIIVLICYLLLSIIAQFIIRSASLKVSKNPEFNQFMDEAFGETSQGEDTLSSQEKIVKIVEDKIKAQNKDLDN